MSKWLVFTIAGSTGVDVCTLEIALVRCRERQHVSKVSVAQVLVVTNCLSSPRQVPAASGLRRRLSQIPRYVDQAVNLTTVCSCRCHVYTLEVSLVKRVFLRVKKTLSKASTRLSAGRS